MRMKWWGCDDVDDDVDEADDDEDWMMKKRGIRLAIHTRVWGPRGIARRR